MINIFKEAWERLTGSVIKKSELIMSQKQKNEAFIDNVKDSTDQFVLLLNNTGNNDYYKEAKLIGFNVKSNKELAKKLKSDCDALIEASESIVELMEDLPKIITDTSMTIKQITILETTKKINNLMYLLPSMQLFILYKVVGDKTMVYKNGYKDIISVAFAYHDTIKEFTNTSIFKDIEGLSETQLRATESEVRAVASNNDKNFKFGKDKFITTWIYNIGKFKVDREIAYIERLKDNKRLLSLKILELQEIESTGNVSTDLSKQIEYYEEKITKIERKIKESSDEE